MIFMKPIDLKKNKQKNKGRKSKGVDPHRGERGSVESLVTMQKKGSNPIPDHKVVLPQ